MEFVSVVDAVRFAVEVQLDIARRNEGIPNDKAMMFRIGINIGDVIAEGDDVLETVSMSPRDWKRWRMQEVSAFPEPFTITSSAVSIVPSKISACGDSRTFPSRSGFSCSVRCREVGADADFCCRNDSLSLARFRHCRIAPRSGSRNVCLVRLQKQTVEIASSDRLVLPLPDKPSIAVLPFANISGDTAQDQFADGMTDDLITDLSKLSGLFVIARNLRLPTRTALLRSAWSPKNSACDTS